MCGIIGYTGGAQAAPKLLNGLKRLDYRGYDSSGIAVLERGKITVVKAEGKVAVLDKKTDFGNALRGTVGIGHTRWATHGVPSDANAHPHASNDGRFAIVHNGIIENFFELKQTLAASGCVFTSETDSEVIVHLIETLYNGDMLATLIKAERELKGSYAVGILCADAPNTIYAIRKDNPLVIGINGKNGENFIASDVAAALEYTHEFVLLDDGEIAAVSPAEVAFYDADGKPITKEPYTVKWNIEQAEKGGYPHFMIKEIHEQPRALTDTVRPRIKRDGSIDLDGIELTPEYIASLDGIDIIGCGSAYHAGVVGKYFIEKHARIRVNCELASEYIYSDPITGANRLTLIISQSGETADTLAALRLAKKRGSRTIAVVNVVESAIAREADGVLYTHAGPEIAVATTKGYTTQIAALYLIGLKAARIKGAITNERYSALIKELLSVSDKVSAMLAPAEIEQMLALAKKYSKNHCAFFIGRGADYAASLEGALKLKEISYIHAEAYAAGELKHGTISLIEEGTVTLALVTQSALYPKMESNIKSVSSRKGTVIAVASPENAKISSASDKVIILPECDDDVAPILAAVALQLFAYYVADYRKCDIDKPRNLAKSVTVE